MAEISSFFMGATLLVRYGTLDVDRPDAERRVSALFDPTNFNLAGPGPKGKSEWKN
jgi:hypothetical protein